jgi:outer membrane protein insertion porin family
MRVSHTFLAFMAASGLVGIATQAQAESITDQPESVRSEPEDSSTVAPSTSAVEAITAMETGNSTVVAASAQPVPLQDAVDVPATAADLMPTASQDAAASSTPDILPESAQPVASEPIAAVRILREQIHQHQQAVGIEPGEATSQAAASPTPAASQSPDQTTAAQVTSDQVTSASQSIAQETASEATEASLVLEADGVLPQASSVPLTVESLVDDTQANSLEPDNSNRVEPDTGFSQERSAPLTDEPLAVEADQVLSQDTSEPLDDGTPADSPVDDQGTPDSDVAPDAQPPEAADTGTGSDQLDAILENSSEELSPEEADDLLRRITEGTTEPVAEPVTEPDAESADSDEATDETAEEEPEEPEEPRVLVAEVQVVASEGTLDEDLEDLVYTTINTQPGRTTTRTQLQQDINDVFATGYFSDVNAVPEDTDLGVRVTYVVQPNPVLADVVLDNNQVMPQEVADEIFADQKGEIINLITFQDGILELNQWYQDNGYVLGQVIAAPQVSDDGVVTLEVAEGVIEEIEVRFLNQDGEAVNEEGEPIDGKTHDYIITREFQTEPGDVFNQTQIERDFQNVFSLNIFEDVVPGLEPGDNDPRQVKVIVNVTERNTGSIAAGLGFNFTGDLFGTVSFRQDNFGGNNQKLTAEAQVSTRDLLFDISFTDPWIAGDPFRTSYTANAFARRAINLNFDGGPNPINLSNGDRARIRRLGGGITFSRPLDNGWTLSVGTLVQNISARDADGQVNAFDAAGNPLTASNTGIDDLWTFPLGAVLDRRNDPFNPTQGSIVRLNSEQSIPLGRGSILMNRLRGSYSYYIPVSLLNFNDGPQALAFNIQAGTIVGDIPPYEAFALGGTNSIRGYDEGDVGSGRSYAQFTAEYRFPLFSFLGGAVFFDAGSDLGSGSAVPGAPGPSRGKPGSGLGYGAGLRVQTPLGPLRIDYGFNDQGDGRIHFGIGERF